MASARVLALALALASLVGCSVAEPLQPTLQIGVTGRMTHFDPARGVEAGTIVLSRYVFRTLPQIASAVRHTTDDRTWTFTIPDGLLFSDGTSLDAPAVAANFERWRVGWYDSDGFLGYARAFMDPKKPYSALDSVAAIDRTTLRIRTHGAFANLPNTLGDPHLAISSPTAFAAGDERYDSAPIGSGPYVVVEKNPDDDIVLAPRRTVAIDRYASVYIRDIVDPHTSVISVRKNDVAVVFGFPADLLNESEHYDLRAVQDPASGYYCAWSPTFPLAKRVCPPAASARDRDAERAKP